MAFFPQVVQQDGLCLPLVFHDRPTGASVQLASPVQLHDVTGRHWTLDRASRLRGLSHGWGFQFRLFATLVTDSRTVAELMQASATVTADPVGIDIAVGTRHSQRPRVARLQAGQNSSTVTAHALVYVFVIAGPGWHAVWIEWFCEPNEKADELFYAGRISLRQSLCLQLMQ